MRVDAAMRVDANESRSDVWSDDGPVSGANYERVQGTTVSCVLTRFRVLSIWSLPLFFVAFRRVRTEARATVPGLITSVFLVEGLRTYYTLSFWTDEAAIVDFNSRAMSHINAANWVIKRVYRKDRQRPEIWSVQCRLWAISPNLNWDGVDLRTILAQQLNLPADNIGARWRRARP